MEITIKTNDAFRVLSDASKLSQHELEERILESLNEEGLFIEGFEMCGKSVAKFMEELGYTIDETVDVIFPNQENTIEFSELLKSIYFWGDAIEVECEECGSEMEPEEESHGNKTWTNYKCENPFCDNAISNEPDWDTMKGGHDY